MKQFFIASLCLVLLIGCVEKRQPKVITPVAPEPESCKVVLLRECEVNKFGDVKCHYVKLDCQVIKYGIR